MKLVFALVVGILAVAAAQQVSAQAQFTPIMLGTNAIAEQPDQAIAGGSVEHMQCILDKLNAKYQIRTLPWRRARQDVRSGRLDGFFTAVSIDTANDYAQFSAPLILESWYWFWRADMAEPESWKKDFQIGTILGSQQEAILSAEGYSKATSANDLKQLIKLLFSKRVDVILVDKELFEQQANSLKVLPGSYKTRFFRYMPLGVYFSNTFLTKRPGFLNEFNGHISQCAVKAFQLSDSEKKRIVEWVTPKLDAIRKSSQVLQAIAKQNQENANKPEAALHLLDERWKAAFTQGDNEFYKAYINLKASDFLGELRLKSNSLLTEVLVTDNRGFNVAVSNMTSDYWQGDEDKYIKTIGLSGAQYFFDDIEYDASSKHFQVQISFPVPDVRSTKNIGVVTFGVDIDKALSQAN